MIIKELDRATAEQIAAGEVIENPASVVKELVENALDAGASKIEVVITGGGGRSITVTDNGHGIAAKDLPLAFRRFATSKITTLEDLQKLSSLGFRGEALPSIAAVARVRLTTRIEGSLAGSEIRLSGGDFISHQEVGAPPGTRVEVSDLFYNTPGRKKFLRAEAVESTRISSQLSEMALAHPDVAFNLKSGNRTLFNSNGDGALLHVIGVLYGNETAAAMIELNRRDRSSGCNLYGYTSSPHMTRSSRRWITLIVNGRLIRSAAMVSALERGYGDLLPSRRHPLAVLHLSIPPGTIDVNVHPAKVEIRFQEPETIKALIYKAVKLSLLEADKMLRWSDKPVYPVLKSDQGQMQTSISPFEERFFEESAAFEPLQEPAFGSISLIGPGVNGVNHEAANGQFELRLIGQFLNSYLIVQKKDMLLLIDQHAAHERIIYHQLKKQNSSPVKGKRAQLTIPLTLELPAAWRDRIARLLPLLDEAGFKLDLIGDDSFAVRAVPITYGQNAGSEQLYDLIEELIRAEEVRESAAIEIIRKKIACHSSVKAGQPLAREEMEHLLRQWEKTPDAQYCPHGRPAVICFDRRSLEKSFKRGSK